MSTSKKTYSFRHLIHILHLWLGLPSALVLFVMCLTGTLYVFSKEITHWLDQDLFRIEATSRTRALPIAMVLETVEQQRKGKITSLTIPQTHLEAWLVVVAVKPVAGDFPPVRTANGGKEKTESYFVDPYQGVVLGNAKTPTSEFFAALLKLHRWLLLDKNVGGIITGTAALIMILLQLTGLFLWLPAKASGWRKWAIWKVGLTIKTAGNWKRTTFDLHKTLGVYTFLFITIMALTGPYFAFDWYKRGASQILKAKPLKKENSFQSVRVSQPLALEQIVRKINVLFPYEGATRLTLPTNSLGSISAQKARTGFFESAAVDRVILDQYTANVFRLDRYEDKTIGQKVVASAKLIHTGELFGAFSKSLYFLACLLATSLPVSGALIWWNRRPKNRRLAGHNWRTKRVDRVGEIRS